MEQPAFITNERLNEFCKHQQAIEDKLSEVADDLKELKDAFNDQAKEYKNICVTGAFVARTSGAMARTG